MHPSFEWYYNDVYFWYRLVVSKCQKQRHQQCEKVATYNGCISVQGAQQKSVVFVSTVWINPNIVEQGTWSNVISNKNVPWNLLGAIKCQYANGKWFV